MSHTAPSTREHSPHKVLDRRLGHDTGDGDPGDIARRLGRKRNLNLVLNRFDDGEADIRDAVGFTVNSRAAVLEFGRGSTSLDQKIMSAEEHQNLQYVISGIANNFSAALHDYEGDTHPQAGYNFAAYATIFRDEGHEWATELDSSLAAFSNEAGSGLDALLALGPEAEYKIRHQLSNYAETNKVNIAWYLAEQSQRSEDIQREMYAPELVKAKQNARRLMLTMAKHYKLPTDHLHRSLTQLERTEFSAFDPMSGGITYADGKSLGDYVDGTLRIEVKLGGSPSRPEHPEDALDTLQHELFHSTSAQDINGRTGLATAKGEGMRPNEGMTELLTQLSLGKIRYENGITRFHVRTAYKSEVKVMHWIMAHDESAFGALYSAYNGYVPDEKLLKHSLDMFYKLLRSVE